MRYRICKQCGELYNVETPCHEEYSERQQLHYVQGDIEPYKCLVDGRWITSRSQHRDSLKRHGCIEAGNEQKYFMNMDKAEQATEHDSKRQEIERKYGPEISKQISKLTRH